MKEAEFDDLRAKIEYSSSETDCWKCSLFTLETSHRTVE